MAEAWSSLEAAGSVVNQRARQRSTVSGARASARGCEWTEGIDDRGGCADASGRGPAHDGHAHAAFGSGVAVTAAQASVDRDGLDRILLQHERGSNSTPQPCGDPALQPSAGLHADRDAPH